MNATRWCLALGALLYGCGAPAPVPEPEPLSCAPERPADCATLAHRVLDAPGATDAELAEVAPMLEIACDAGMASSCAGLGAMYDHGWGVAQSDGAARDAYEGACEGGEACVELGRMVLDGRGGEQDPVRALALFSGACERGHAEACALEGLQLAVGGGVENDPVRGEALLRAACEDGIAWACDVDPTSPPPPSTPEP